MAVRGTAGVAGLVDDFSGDGVGAAVGERAGADRGGGVREVIRGQHVSAADEGAAVIKLHGVACHCVGVAQADLHAQLGVVTAPATADITRDGAHVVAYVGDAWLAGQVGVKADGNWIGGIVCIAGGVCVGVTIHNNKRDGDRAAVGILNGGESGRVAVFTIGVAGHANLR